MCLYMRPRRPVRPPRALPCSRGRSPAPARPRALARPSWRIPASLLRPRHFQVGSSLGTQRRTHIPLAYVFAHARLALAPRYCQGLGWSTNNVNIIKYISGHYALQWVSNTSRWGQHHQHPCHFSVYGQFSKFYVCFCGLDPGNLKFETVRTNKQHICF